MVIKEDPDHHNVINVHWCALNHLAMYQNQLIRYLESWRKRERPADVSPSEVVRGRFKQKVRKTLTRLAKRIGSASELTPDDINPAVGEITDQSWNGIVQAFLQEAREGLPNH